MDQPRRSRIVWIELAIGVAAVGLGLLAYGSMPIPFSEPSSRGNPFILAGLVGLAIGLIWMIRIIRRPTTRR